MATKNLGKVFMTPKGQWDKTLSYTKLDIVTNKVGKISSGYIATTDIEKNVEITDNRWLKLFELLDGDLTDEQVSTAVQKYLEENPVSVLDASTAETNQVPVADGNGNWSWQTHQSGTCSEETDPTVPNWAKQPNKPTYTADEVGADPSGTSASKVSEHNTSDTAHNDIRTLIAGLTSRLNALADSDDTTLDQMSEVVAYIKSNKLLIDAISTSKVNVSDIIDNLTTNVSNKPLSAAQGVKLKALIDAIAVPTKLSELENDSGYAKTTDIPDKLPNPQKLTFAGAIKAEYDGSGAVTVTIPESSGGSGVSDEKIAEAVGTYMEEHPIEESDPTVPEWAKQSEKPSYTASEVGALPNTTIIPTTLPNPNALTFTGAATGSYDGSSPVEINIPEGGGTDVAVDATLSVAGQAADAKATGDAISSLSEDISDIQNKTDNPVSPGKIWTSTENGATWEDPLYTGAFINDNSVSQDSTWSSRKIASELNKIEHTLTISLNAIDGGDIYTTVIIENATTGEVVETLDYNNEILYVVLPKYFSYRVTIGDVDGYVKPNVNVFTGVMNRDITISATYKFGMIYGYHVNNNESDPSSAVTYIEDAVGFTPAKMNYSTDVFEYGSWENAFFMPKPCMLKRDGTVDYYLDANNYTLKENGESSDIENEYYDGNAMMEWGQNGKKIYYKMVNDEDGNGYSVYISEFKASEDYHCWSFINNQGKLVDHFYTPIYNGSLDSNNCLRSLSGKAYMMSKDTVTEISYAKSNNLTSDMLWYTEVYCDIILINSLLVLMGKSLNTQYVYGQGHTTGGSETVLQGERTGTMNDKGMFYGTNDTTHHVKVFGMENWWGCQWRRFGGLMLKNYKYYYKLTNGTQDGSTATTYGTTTVGMIESKTSAPTSNGYQKKMIVENGVSILTSEVGGSDSTYYCDNYYIVGSSEIYAYRGGRSDRGSECGAFAMDLDGVVEYARWRIGAALSCKPLART